MILALAWGSFTLGIFAGALIGYFAAALMWAASDRSREDRDG